jgi:hypothetical protein
MMDDLITFSAYWHVDGNIKLTARKGHIKHAERKKLDYFICPEDQHGQFKRRINLDFNDLPSVPYIKNLTSMCESTDREHLYGKCCWKKGCKRGFKPDVFLQLATIWTSKVLLFAEMLKHTAANYLMWMDCVTAHNHRQIAALNSDKCCLNKYKKNQLTRKIFGGLIENTLPTIKPSACVIKLPRCIVDEFVEKYIKCLQFVDDNFLIYDEEVVLSIMNQKHPHLFDFSASK